MDDATLLKLVKAERAASVGFEHDETLRADREKALQYYKGEMKDVPALPNRSRAVSTDVADAIETLLPDLVEIFTGGDDVATFRARGPQDEAAAAQETDYVNHVVFDQNRGFLTLYSFFKDALQLKTGVVTWWWENAPEDGAETFEGVTAAQAAVIAQECAIVSAKPSESASSEPAAGEGAAPAEPLFDIEVAREGPDGRACVLALAPEDFTVARDTVELSEASYCAYRTRPRAQQLIADGHDRALIDKLPGYNPLREEMELARDTAGEQASLSASDAARDMRQVEVVVHFLRLVGERGKLEVWRVLTGADETVLIDKEKVDRVRVAAITPRVVTHRFYGESVADQVMEIQRIKTALTRAKLDHVYFALNQRVAVDMTKANEFTLSDLLDNRPGMPVRMDGPGAVTPLGAGGIDVNLSEDLEYFSTVLEQRTGIVRNANGLAPDTLHDTASGMERLMANAAKRVRLIARVFAETGVKDLFLGVHALLRQHAAKAAVTRLRGQWVEVDPTSWGEREDMTIEVGLGSAGRAGDLATLAKVLEFQQQIVARQGGVNGPLVTAANVHAALSDFVSKSGSKKAEAYFTDPASAPPPPPPGPHPELLKAQIKAQGAQQAAEAQAAIRARQVDGELALKRYEIDQSARLEALKSAVAPHAPGLPPVEFGGRPG